LPEPVAALVLDFDGVFTDNRVIVDQDGRESVICDRGDGWLLSHLKKTGLPILILSTETNPVVQARADKLGIPCLQGIPEKGVALKGWAAGRGIDLAHLVYLGNDINDLDCLELAGCGVITADAHPSVRQVADLVLQNRGGHGALRELCEMILACKQ
jgi:N-acylneuraminate cytidylyltransferase